MDKSNQTGLLFEKSMAKVNRILKITGTHLKDEDTDRTLFQRLRHRFSYWFNLSWLDSDLACEIAWFLNGTLTGQSFTELTYALPCITLCILGNMKGYYSVKYAHHLNEIVHTLRKLQNIEMNSGKVRKEIDDELIERRYPFLNWAVNMLTFINFVVIFAFGLSPLLVTGVTYYKTGELELLLPFLMLYPFDATDIRIWPFVFLHQVWAGIIAVFSVFGPDCFYYTCCTYIHIHFRTTQYDMERIIASNSNELVKRNDIKFRSEFMELVERHQVLIRCVELLEIIYSKSALLNAVTSSVLICLTGFNVTAIDNFFLIAPFIIFLGLCLFQIYFFCYFGDTVMQSSMDLSDAVFHCQWYNAETFIRRDLIFILTRAQKPCKLTAYGFADINLRAFTRILSTAWSYFALLKTMYRGGKMYKELLADDVVL